METTTVLAFARRWSGYIIASTIVGALAALLVSTQLPKSYDATTTLIVGASLTSPTVGYDDLLVSQTLAQTYAAVAGTSAVTDAAAQATSIDPEVVAKAVDVRVPPASSFVIITASANDADDAAAIANAVAAALIATSPAAGSGDQAAEQLYQLALTTNANSITEATSQRDTLLAVANPTAAQASELAQLQARLVGLDTARAELISNGPAQGTNRLTVIDPASAPTTAAGPRTLLNVALGAAVGFAIGLGLAVLLQPLLPSQRGKAEDQLAQEASVDPVGLSDPRWPSTR